MQTSCFDVHCDLITFRTWNVGLETLNMKDFNDQQWNEPALVFLIIK